MISSDVRNKETALARIKRLASSGLPLEPFARAVLDELHVAIPYSPNRPMVIAGANGTDIFVCPSSDLIALLPAYQHYFLEHPALSGARFGQDGRTLRRVLPRQTVWRHEEMAHPDILKRDGFNAVMRPARWHHLVEVAFIDEGEYAGYAPLWRSEDQKDFAQADYDFLQSAAPHITHGLKLAQLRRNEMEDGRSFKPLENWNAGAILLDEKGKPIALDENARVIFEQMGGLDGVGADGFHLPQIRDALAYISQTLNGIFHDPDSGLSVAGPPVARLYAHWSGIVLKLRGLQMVGADGREYTTVLVERGETAEVRRRQMIARWGLSQREGEVLDLICDNKTGPEIAILVKLSHDTVRKHTSSILAKFGVETRAGAVAAVRDFN